MYPSVAGDPRSRTKSPTNRHWDVKELDLLIFRTWFVEWGTDPYLNIKKGDDQKGSA